MYGEAPLFTAVWLFRRAGVTRGSHVLDVGAGRGRALLAARWLGAQAVGIELNPSHVTQAASAIERAGGRLERGDATVASLEGVSHVFLSWYAFSAKTKERLVERLARTPDGLRVIAVSAPVEHPHLPLRLSTHGLFTWGLAPVFLHERDGSTASASPKA
jgi:SAM-dependent methyltransferase